MGNDNRPTQGDSMPSPKSLFGNLFKRLTPQGRRRQIALSGETSFLTRKIKEDDDMSDQADIIYIPDHEIKMDFVRASGPGGQHVNKVSTAVHLRFDVINSPTLPERVRQRLIRLAGKRMDSQGFLHINASSHRTQHMNREDAKARLNELIQKARIRPKKRIKTKPTAASKRRILDSKNRKGLIKSLRGRVRDRGDE